MADTLSQDTKEQKAITGKLVKQATRFVNLHCISTTMRRRRPLSGPAFCWFAFLALRLWPAVRCAQGHGLRCASGPRARKLFRSLALAGKTLRPDLALRGPHAGPNLQCQKANRTGGNAPHRKVVQ
jgi:hypothetical protein